MQTSWESLQIACLRWLTKVTVRVASLNKRLRYWMVQSRVLESDSILNFSVRNRSLTMACPSLIAPAPQGRAPGRTRQRPAKEIEARRVRPGLCVRLEKFCGGSGRKAAIHVANRCSHQLPRIPAQRHSHDDRRYTAAPPPSHPGRNP